MTVIEAKRLIIWAQKRGVKSLIVGDVSVTFQDAAILPRQRKAALVDAEVPGLPAPIPEPTLEQINAYIYETQASG